MDSEMMSMTSLDVQSLNLGRTALSASKAHEAKNSDSISLLEMKKPHYLLGKDLNLDLEEPNTDELVQHGPYQKESIRENFRRRRMSSQGAGEVEDEHLAENAALFLFICMLIGQLLRIVASRTGIPYTSLLTVVGCLMGFYYDKLGTIQAALKLWGNMPPHFLLFIFIPALIFESAFSTDWYIFKAQLSTVLMMAGPMLLISTFLSAYMMFYIYGYNSENAAFTMSAALLFGSIISATDPVAVVALLKELGASRRLATLIEGESLMNDGTAMVVFLILMDVVKGMDISPM